MRRININIWRIGVMVGGVLATGGLLAGGHGAEGGRALPAVANTAWQAECASCHMAYHPGLLPARSWQAMMGTLDRHFGENAVLDAATQGAITEFLVANAADRNGNRRSGKIAASIPANGTPLRISETAYIRAKHDEIAPGVWLRPRVGGRANCGGCHGGVQSGDFSERSVTIPPAGAAVVASRDAGTK
jgi:hypothetical protein